MRNRSGFWWIGVVSLPLMAVGCGAESDQRASGSELTELYTVGVVRGESREELGEIIDLEVLPDESFLVMERAGRVLWFDRGGQFTDAIDERGQGPGELLEPMTMVFLPPDTLLVVDTGNDRFSFYGVGGGTFRRVRSRRSLSSLLAGSGSICRSDGRLFLRIARDGSRNHELGEGGDSSVPSERDFGSFASTLVIQKNAGRLLCLDDPPRLVSASRYLPDIRGYTLSGDLLGVGRLSPPLPALPPGR